MKTAHIRSYPGGRIHLIGLAVLLALMVLILTNDVRRIIVR